jgi:hypothetical protein
MLLPRDHLIHRPVNHKIKVTMWTRPAPPKHAPSIYTVTPPYVSAVVS